MRGLTQSGITNLDDTMRAVNNIRLVLRSLNIFTGDGSPEGVIPANVGSIYLRTDGSTDTCLYVKETGDSTLSTGWIAK